MGAFLQANCVSAHQKVGTFRLANGRKQGGNVASYFCAPDGTVVHAVAGQVTGSQFLREARWAVEVYNLAAADGQADGVALRAAVRKAHLARLKELRLPPPDVLPPLLTADGPTVAALPHHGRGGNAGKVHTLLAAHPLPRLDDVYPIVWEQVLNEQRSTAPVRVTRR